MGRPQGAGRGEGAAIVSLLPPPSAPPDPWLEFGRGPRTGLSRSPAGNRCPHASSFLGLPAACRPLLPARARAPSLFPSSGRLLLLLLLAFSLDLSLPARNPFRPGSRSGLAAVCRILWPSGGPPFQASVGRCVRLLASPGEPLAPPRARSPGQHGEPPPGDHPGVGSPSRGGPRPPFQPPSLGLSRDPGAQRGRTGTCPARPFVVMPQGEGDGRGEPRLLTTRTPSPSPSPYETPESSEPGRAPRPGLGQI